MSGSGSSNTTTNDDYWSYPGDVIRDVIAAERNMLTLLEAYHDQVPKTEFMRFAAQLKQDWERISKLKIPRNPLKVREENWIKSLAKLRDFLLHSCKPAEKEVSYEVARKIADSVAKYPPSNMGGSYYHLEHFHPDSEIAQIIREVEGKATDNTANTATATYRVQYYDDSVYSCYIKWVKVTSSTNLLC